ncbi:MAG TPA: Rne/Rng family ribonuclease, partial [Mycobacteriales bacterium]|nr:Rne/Rng family ribonuclease [Mycobacteriales bacterium]
MRPEGTPAATRTRRASTRSASTAPAAPEADAALAAGTAATAPTALAAADTEPAGTPAKKTTRTRRTRAAAAPAAETAAGAPPAPSSDAAGRDEVRGTSAPALADAAESAALDSSALDSAALGKAAPAAGAEPVPAAPAGRSSRRRAVATPVFQAPQPVVLPRPLAVDAAVAPADESEASTATREPATDRGPGAEDDTDGEGGQPRRRRRGRRGRGGRGRGENESGEPRSEDDDENVGVAGTEESTAEAGEPADQPGEVTGGDADESESGDAGSSRRRRRRRRRGVGEGGEESVDDPPNTVVRTREPRPRRPTGADAEGVRGLSGSTRLEAKRQRRRDGRPDRRRVPVITEAEFLARREAVERMMIVRNQGERTQIAVLEDGVLVEHYVTRGSSSAFAGNVYVGKVQNVLPSMEAAFVDIGKGRNAVLYAGEVNYDAAAMEGSPRPRTIQEALKSGQNVLVQVSKDPLGQKGARLTSQITLPGRYLVYVPEGSMTGISRKLPDTERARLKSILKKIVPDDAGVIIRTAAEGASEEELTRDVERLQQQWEQIKKAADKAAKNAPALVHAEPDLVVRVVRDVFNEDFTGLVIQGDDEWTKIESYVSQVAPELMARASRWTGEQDVFTQHRVDEQLTKALDRKVHLPSGGSLVIDRTEAMTVVDVNTGKFTGKGGNLEETVTKNNLEAAEEIVRQLRLRDVGGIIVIDFIDMVLESNRELVLRRLTECLGRDRTRHQVAEVTSLGLVQMTRKRVGTGLLEAYSETCEACNGRGVLIHLDGAPARSGTDFGSPR